MEQTIGIAVFSILILGVVFGGWFFISRHKRLDQTYHDALHAESSGNYAIATQLYQSIMDSSGILFKMDKTVRTLVKRRIDTIRYQQDYLSQFARMPNSKDDMRGLEGCPAN